MRFHPFGGLSVASASHGTTASAFDRHSRHVNWDALGVAACIILLLMLGLLGLAASHPSTDTDSVGAEIQASWMSGA
jgi:hypothetical protein